MNAIDRSDAPEKTVHVFVSYAREDKRWLDPEYRYNLIPFLAESLRRHNVVFWYDTELKPGDVFKRQIEAEIDQAQVALLIVSQSFLNSDFIEQIEVPRIAERARRSEAIVIPVLVEPCDWSDYPFLADRQMVPSSNPLIDYTESEAKWAKVKFQILDGLKAQLKRIRETPQSTVPASHGTDVHGTVPEESARSGAAISSDPGSEARNLAIGASAGETSAQSRWKRIPAWAGGGRAERASLVLFAIIALGLGFWGFAIAGSGYFAGDPNNTFSFGFGRAHSLYTDNRTWLEAIRCLIASIGLIRVDGLFQPGRDPWQLVAAQFAVPGVVLLSAVRLILKGIKKNLRR